MEAMNSLWQNPMAMFTLHVYRLSHQMKTLPIGCDLWWGTWHWRFSLIWAPRTSCLWMVIWWAYSVEESTCMASTHINMCTTWLKINIKWPRRTMDLSEYSNKQRSMLNPSSTSYDLWRFLAIHIPSTPHTYSTHFWNNRKTFYDWHSSVWRNKVRSIESNIYNANKNTKWQTQGIDVFYILILTMQIRLTWLVPMVSLEETGKQRWNMLMEMNLRA